MRWDVAAGGPARRPAKRTTPGEPLAARATRAWVRLYTAGLAPELRDERRMEVESDLHEHRKALAETPGRFSREVAWRCALGMPADVAWRIEHARLLALLQIGVLAVLARLEAWGRWSVRKGLPGISVLLAAFYLLVGVIMALTLPFEGATPAGERAWGAFFLLASGTILLVGLRVVGAHWKLGMGLILAGAVPLAIAFPGAALLPTAATAATATGLIRAWKGRRKAA